VGAGGGQDPRKGLTLRPVDEGRSLDARRRGVEVDTWEENRAIGWKTRKGFRQDGSWVFREKDGGTEAAFTVEYDLPGGIAGKMMAKAVEPALRSTLQGSVKQLKEQTGGVT
jgi:uncharacterized membrane protein